MWGYGNPTPKSGGTRTLRTPVSYAYGRLVSTEKLEDKAGDKALY